MAYPLPGHEDGQLRVESEHNLFKGRRVFIPQKIINQAGILPDRLGSLAVRDPCSLDDTLVAPHIINQSDKTLIEHREFPIQNFIRLRYHTTTHNFSFTRSVDRQSRLEPRRARRHRHLE